MGIKLADLAEMLQGEVLGDAGLEIEGAGGLDDAGKKDITFLEKVSLLDRAERSRAAAVIVPPEITRLTKPGIRMDNPRLGFLKVLQLFEQPPQAALGVHPTAVVGKNVRLGKSISVHPYVVIGDSARVGDGVVIFSHCVIGKGCRIGEGTVLFPRVTLYDGVQVGKNCRLHSGVVVGADGFGYVSTNGRHLRVPHIGTVVLEDEVEVGANSTIDRGTTKATRIRAGSKIDNLVHVAHNVTIGKGVMICAQCGLSGSVELGDRVVLAGQVGVADHKSIGSGATIGAQAGVTSNVPPGEFYSGYPARPHGEQMRALALLHRLAELNDRVRRLEEQGKSEQEEQEK